MLRFCRVQQLLFFSFLSWFKAEKTSEGKVGFITDKVDFGGHDINAHKHGVPNSTPWNKAHYPPGHWHPWTISGIWSLMVKQSRKT